MELYVATNGCDQWSGQLAAPNADGTDGPLATVRGARDRVRQLAAAAALDAPVKVWIRGGTYPLTGPIEFGPEDDSPTQYAAYGDEIPIFDGGRRITNWRTTSVHGRHAWVAEIPEAAAGQWIFRQLFVNGQRRPRTRLPAEGFYRIEDVPGVPPTAPFSPEGSHDFRAAEGDIQAWKNLQDVEVIVCHW